MTTIRTSCLLFDMDGTLIDSTAGVQGAWELFAQTYPSIDVTHILSAAHGIRTADNLRTYCGITDPDKLKAESNRFEEAIVTTSSENGRRGIVRLPGVLEVMNQISDRRFLPNPCWAICTSSTRMYSSLCLERTGIPIPDVIITADDVSMGKPHPEPYLAGAARCNVKPEQCIVFEDAPSGVRSGKAAGCVTVGLLTTHSEVQMKASEPDFLIQNLESVSVKVLANGIEVTLQDALRHGAVQ